MTPKDLKIGKIYTLPFKKENFHMIFLSKEDDMLNFATYNDGENAWYIPDTWNYDYENDDFQKFKAPKGLGKQDMVQSLFENRK